MTTNKLASFQKTFLFVCLGIATFMVSIDYAITNISIPYIAGDLAVNNDQGTYVITWFAVGNALGLAMTGWLTQRIGEIKLLLYSIALFILFSWFCGFSLDLNMLVISRFLQGFAGGPIVPLAQSLIVQYGSVETRRKDLAIWGGILIIAPILGPIAGGYISYWYAWPWIFYINIPIGIFCILSIWTLMRDEPAKIIKVPGDIPGMILLMLGVACLQIFLDKGQDWDWLNSNTIRLLILGFITAFTYCFIWEFWSRTPLLNLRLFSIPSFTVSIICLIISYAIYFGTIVLVPLWLQQTMGYDAVWAGITVATLGIGPLLFSMFTPRVTQRYGNIRTLIFGFVLFAIGCFFNAYFTTTVTPQYVAFARFLFGLAFIFYINPLIGMSVEDIPLEQLPNATGIFHFIRALVGGIGTAIFKTLWERRTIYHHETIGSRLTPFNPSTPQLRTSAELSHLNNLVDQQAALLAINDAFYLMGWCFVALVVFLLVWYLWTCKDKKGPSHKAARCEVE